MEDFAAVCRDRLTVLYIHPKHPDWDLRQSIYMRGAFRFDFVLRSRSRKRAWHTT